MSCGTMLDYISLIVLTVCAAVAIFGLVMMLSGRNK